MTTAGYFRGIRPVGQLAQRFQLTKRAVLIQIARVLLAAVVLGIWELVSRTGAVNPFWISSPSKIGDQLWELVESGRAFRHVWVTVYEAMVGLAVGSALGILAGFLLARWHIVEKVVEPYITALNSVPRLALTPLFIIWFGIGLASKVALVVSLVFFPLLVNTHAAVKSVDPDLLIVARLLGASRRRIARSVVLPSAVPWIFAGLRLGLAFAFGGAVVGEMIGAQAGLGYLVSYSAGILNITGVMVAVVLVMIVAYLADTILSATERKLLKWRPTGITGAGN